MCKASDTNIVNKGSGQTDNEIVNDQSTNLISFHERHPVAAVMFFGVLALIIYFIHRRYCSQKAVTNPVDQASSPTPAAMAPTAPPSVLFPLQQPLNLQQPSTYLGDIINNFPSICRACFPFLGRHLNTLLLLVPKFDLSTQPLPVSRLRGRTRERTLSR